MNIRNKPWLALISIIVLAALFLLAVGISQVKLAPGSLETFGFNRTQTPSQVSPAGQNDSLLGILRIAYIVGIILLPVLIITLIVSKQARKQFLRSLIGVLPFILLLFVFKKITEQAAKATQEPPALSPPGASNLANAGKLITITAATPPAWLIVGATVGVAIVITVIIAGIAWYFLRRNRKEENSLGQIANEAQNALDALKSGGDLKNVVIRCYYQMNEILKQEKGIRRDEAMTPREFEARLTKAGLPGSAVRELTRLFEEVRYGLYTPGLEDEVAAVASLTAIVDACKSL
jgi:4-amino-4-deoxy-L-arabinose transferase-like glycosyltransferase